MTFETSSYNLTIIAISSSVTATGIAYLIKLIWSHHKARKELIIQSSFKRMNEEINAADNVLEMLNLNLEKKISSLNEITTRNETEQLDLERNILMLKLVKLNSSLKSVRGIKMPNNISKFFGEVEKLAGTDEESIKNYYEKVLDKKIVELDKNNKLEDEKDISIDELRKQIAEMILFLKSKENN